MKEIDYMAVAEKAMNQIKEGAFLTVRAGEALNTMTIGWATIGYVWRKPVFMVLVRDSRHTFGIIEKAADFTVSVPMTD
ncbi:MAG: flavin reductase, partial [Desulfobacteraceae bacterium 4484_190.1]